ncbi:tRNA-binding protein [Niabella ginsenosidivorans]|uniref:tRNA-binding protein n=1 Tax=Niabella ginsenosidivorans TaxID=1176587 RepID=A0A1A9HXQ0_9BACT|nr:tRNA-binding protein [Niabella ginsenosidivorans]ANH79855.1 tRNA-binding protein [Niabella ginsenosidivorans]
MQTGSFINWADFEKIEMRTGTITHAEVFKEARKPAYKLTLDFGEYGTRRSSAQLTKLYSAEDLLGRQVIAVLNFPRKQIANFFSECLVLGIVGDENTITLLSPERSVPNGLRVG